MYKSLSSIVSLIVLLTGVSGESPVEFPVTFQKDLQLFGVNKRYAQTKNACC